MRTYPALRITFFDPSTQEQLDRLLAGLDDYQPTAIEDVPNGVLAFFGTGAARDEALAHFGAFELVDVVTEDVPDENWAERSQAALTPVTVGRLTITPPWCARDDLRAQAPGPLIVIQPSMGFGTGHHASTRLCLEALQTIPLPGKRVLDIGTGSGVLALAARLFGAAQVVGIDVDPDALENARENLQLNPGIDEVRFIESDVRAAAERTSPPYDVVLANLTGSLLQREVESITSLAAGGGHLIVSGFQVHEDEAVRAAFESAGWRSLDRVESDSWVALTLEL